eukprot:6207835-Pleurochrysis_carterae.AAC.1
MYVCSCELLPESHGVLAYALNLSALLPLGPSTSPPLGPCFLYTPNASNKQWLRLATAADTRRWWLLQDPDLISCAKQLTGGYVPLSACIVPEHFYQARYVPLPHRRLTYTTLVLPFDGPREALLWRSK